VIARESAAGTLSHQREEGWEGIGAARACPSGDFLPT
jgi:hypothetical protein